MKRIFLGLIILMFLESGLAYAGPYTNSAHGNTAYGVDRISTTQYTTGHCAHCHEQHAGIGGVEPAPSGGPDNYLLFNPNHSSQTVNLCFDCHRGPIGGHQTGGLVNRSYSHRAGGWTSDPLDDILEAFTYGTSTTTGSSHNLNDISAFITGKWGYTADSNPCAACHNPHVAQGDPANSPNTAKSPTTRGWPVTRPSKHGSLLPEDILWGDDTGEKMSDYAGTLTTYQAPYRFGSTTAYEPDSSTTITDGSNLTDYVTFCTDCHNATNTIYSTNLGRNLRTIDWANAVHGKGNADTYITVDSPYTSGSGSLGYVLSCLDCHEPHGSPNAFLIRKEVNGAVLGGEIAYGTDADKLNNGNWHYLCDRCHRDDKELSPSCQEDHYYLIHHNITYGGDPYDTGGRCGQCHGCGGGGGGGGGGSGCGSNRIKLVCTNCHYHGSTHSGHMTF